MSQLKALLCSVLMLNTISQAETLASKNGASSLGVCYLPTESNVTYSEVLALPVESPDHVISYGPDDYQFAELWLPKRADAEEPIRRHPLVILVHGGCWLNSFDIKHTHALSTALMSAGYAVWSVEYRRTGDNGGGWPGSYNDIKLAIAHLPKLADYSVDLNKVAIAGHSAGGHLALLAGSDRLYDFGAVIGLAAIVDLEKYAIGENSCQVATPRFMVGTSVEFPERYAAANPAKKIPHASTILIHGAVDSIVSPEHASYLNSDSQIIEGAGHFDMVHPGTQSYQALLKALAKAFR